MRPYDEKTNFHRGRAGVDTDAGGAECAASRNCRACRLHIGNPHGAMLGVQDQSANAELEGSPEAASCAAEGHDSHDAAEAGVEPAATHHAAAAHAEPCCDIPAAPASGSRWHDRSTTGQQAARDNRAG